MAELSVSREIAASADDLYAMVSDVTRMGEWSPESQGGVWSGGATGPVVGARFTTKNTNGSKAWKTGAVVVAAQPGQLFTFRVGMGPIKIADWSYAFEPTADGCRVTESWTDLRSGWFKPISRMGTGVTDREEHNRRGMEQTLERLAAAAEH